MGQIADDVACGFQCSGCGVCFVEEHGYPVLCADCHSDWPVEQGESSTPKATNKEI